MKKILIIGGCGYIGSSLYEFLKTKHIVDTIDLEWFGNFVNEKNLAIDFDEITNNMLDNYDTIILVAANSSVQLCADIKSAFDNNVVKFFNLVKKIKKQKFIYASSSCVYVTSDDKEKVETDILSPLDGLTLTKTTIDQLMPLLDIEYYGLRFGSVNGWSPNMRLDLMINSMTMNSLINKEVNVFNAHAHRPILGMVDLCRAVNTIIESSEDKRGLYNLASVNHNIGEIGKMVSEYMKVKLNDKGSNYTYDFTISSEKFVQAYDFTFRDSVQTIVEDIVSKPHNQKWKKRETI